MSLQKKLYAYSELLLKDAAVSNVAGFGGSGSSSNSARVFVVLKPHHQRDPIEQVMERLRDKVKRKDGVRPYV